MHPLAFQTGHGPGPDRLAACWLVLVLVRSAVWADEPIQLGPRRELFIDRFLVAKMEGARLKLHEPRREGTAIRFDQPWEGGFSGYATVLKDGERYRLYYRGKPVADQDGSTNEVVCYAESADGVTWTKPNLGLFAIHGTPQNNVVLTNPPFAHNFSPFLDERPGISQEARFKALAGLQSSGLHAFASADGIHWRSLGAQPVFTQGAFDSQNVAFWSAAEQGYLCYFRTWKTIGSERFRWISRTSSPDFVHWREPVEMQFGGTPPEHLYTSGTHPYYRAPHVYIGLAKRFFPTRAALTPEAAQALVRDPGYRVASSDSVLLSTRGGDRYDRTFLEAFIRPGPEAADWVSRDNTPALGVVPAGEREMFLYRQSHYAQPTSQLTRYSLRTDGFVSVNAPYQGGELVTKPLTFTGNRLELNFATSAAGGLRVELQDETGQALPGYSLAQCPELLGDAVSRIVSWASGPDVGALAGKVIRLHFVLKDADLYSLRFFSTP